MPTEKRLKPANFRQVAKAVWCHFDEKCPAADMAAAAGRGRRLRPSMSLGTVWEARERAAVCDRHRIKERTRSTTSIAQQFSINTSGRLADPVPRMTLFGVVAYFLPPVTQILV
jgi:hypothetical protein